MPFGSMFGAVVFTVLCLWYGNEVFAAPSVPGVLTGLLWGALGTTLSLGLVLRQPWARWAGIGASCLLVAIGARQILSRGEVLDHVVLLSSIATLVLLAVPATGDARRGRTVDAPRRPFGRSLGWASVTSLLSLACIVVWSGVSSSEIPSEQPQEPESARTLPRRGHPRVSPAVPAPPGAPAVKGGVELAWRSYGTGLKQAKTDQKAVLIDFFASWCGPCKVMERNTFRNPDVVRRLEGIVPVRVDAEDERLQDGFAGSDLAGKYRIQGFPTVVLLDPQGREISRRTGYVDPTAFVDWLDRVLGPKPASSGDPARNLRAARP